MPSENDTGMDARSRSRSLIVIICIFLIESSYRFRCEFLRCSFFFFFFFLSFSFDRRRSSSFSSFFFNFFSFSFCFSQNQVPRSHFNKIYDFDKNLAENFVFVVVVAISADAIARSDTSTMFSADDPLDDKDQTKIFRLNFSKNLTVRSTSKHSFVPTQNANLAIMKSSNFAKYQHRTDW